MAALHQARLLCLHLQVLLTVPAAAHSLHTIGEGQEVGEKAAFAAFVQTHQRSYREGSHEYELRRSLFQERRALAARHNSKPERSWSWDPGNRFADRTDAEIAAFRAWRGPKHHRAGGASFLEKGSWSHQRHMGSKQCALPKSVSWGYLNSTQGIRDQGSCGSCSALATSVTLAAHSEIHRGEPRTFAPQELVSCTKNPEACGGEGGCKGGFMELLMAYVLRHGLHDENDYEYTSGVTGETGTCKTLTVDEILVATRPGIYAAAESGASHRFGMVGYERLPTNRYEPVMRALVERGPITVALSADEWQWYGSGIFDHCQKDAIIDHAVVLLGFGEDRVSGKRFWELQNSWGPFWGENGRIKLLRLADEEAWCGQDSKPELGAACAKNKDGSRKPTPLPPVEVCGSCGILFNAVVPHFQGSSPTGARLSALRESCGAE